MKTVFAFLFTTLSLLIISSASAQSLYWDPGQSSGANVGGTGNWDTTDPFWYNGTADAPWVNNADAYFTNTAGTVTLTTSISAGDIYFTNVVGNYDITNDNNGEVLTVGSVIDTGGSEDVMGVPLSNSGTLIKNGAGRLHLPLTNTLNNVTVNQGELSVESIGGLGNAITVASGAALELNSGTNNIGNSGGPSGIAATATISGTGITNTGAILNVSGVNVWIGGITLAQNNSMIFADTDTALILEPFNFSDVGVGPPDITDNGNGYNLIISGAGTGDVYLEGPISIGGSLLVEGTATCYNYLNSITSATWTTWKSTYVGPGATLGVENFNSFGTDPASLMKTNCILDGATLISGGTYTMYANTGIFVTTNGGTLTDSTGTWTTGNIYSSNTAVTLNCIGSMRPGGAAGGILGTINLGTGTLIKSGTGDCNLGYANPTNQEIYSNIVVNGSGSLTFNYDSTGGQSSLGAVPSSLNPSNIWINGGSLHVGHSTTIAATRGIYLTPAGGTIEDVVSSGGTVTINSPISGPGALNVPNGHSGETSAATFVGANTYTGGTTIGASSQVTVSGASGTLGLGPVSDGDILAFSRTGTYTYNFDISGTGVVNNTGSGTVILGGTNTYTGATTISAGTLDIDGTNGTSPITVSSGGTLGGTGFIAGTVTVNSGGTLALGGSGVLSVSNNVTLSGNVSVSVNSSASPANGMANVSGTLSGTSTGKIVVSNLGPALTTGESFTLFNEPVSGGSSMTITGGGSGGYTVSWANNLANNGSITVQGLIPPKPAINKEQLSGGNFILSGTNGAVGTNFIVLTSTNLLLPTSQWTPISTNPFQGNGGFSFTNAINPGTPVLFYLLQVQ